ncbi:hypothetical protein B0H19DRAFT_1173360 [Mycena capillaripes]|nr:hypothetical protein B0H19DRAFT_1173360 [Mycena capillaripes]
MSTTKPAMQTGCARGERRRGRGRRGTCARIDGVTEGRNGCRKLEEMCRGRREEGGGEGREEDMREEEGASMAMTICVRVLVRYRLGARCTGLDLCLPSGWRDSERMTRKRRSSRVEPAHPIPSIHRQARSIVITSTVPYRPCTCIPLPNDRCTPSASRRRCEYTPSSVAPAGCSQDGGGKKDVEVEEVERWRRYFCVSVSSRRQQG